MNVSLLCDHDFDFLNIKTDTKNGPNLINLEGQEIFKTKYLFFLFII